MPDTILGWYRKLIANKFDGSRFRRSAGRPRVAAETERLVVRMAKENPTWGYDRIVGALANLGQRLSDQTVGNILRRHGIPPAVVRQNQIARTMLTFNNLEGTISRHVRIPTRLVSVDLAVHERPSSPRP